MCELNAGDNDRLLLPWILGATACKRGDQPCAQYSLSDFWLSFASEVLWVTFAVQL